MALFTIPELLLGVVGVPQISFADAAVLYDTCANGRARGIDKLKNREFSFVRYCRQIVVADKVKSHTYFVQCFLYQQ